MHQPARPRVVRQAFLTVALFLATLAITYSLPRHTFPKPPFAIFVAATAIAAWQAGWLSGIIVGFGGILTVLAFDHFTADRLAPAALIGGVVIIVNLFSASRERATKSLYRSETRQDAILDAALDGIITMGSDGRVIEWNPAATQMFGYSRDQAVGQEMAALIIPPRYRDAHRAGLRKYLATGEGPVIGQRLELAAVGQDGVEFPVELAITRVPLPGPAMFTGHVRDISARLLAEAAIVQSEARFRQLADERIVLLDAERGARAEAERASRLKDEFLATLSHELRTPLHAILAWSQVLAQSKDPADVAEGLKTIERNARAQTQIIEDLLDMSRIISGKIRLDVQRVDLAPVMQAAIETVQPAADAKGVRIQAVLDPLARPVSGDPARLQQIFWNLLSNAIKFTPRGGRVQVVLQRVESHLQVSVADTGEGISPEFLPYVFDRFRQGDASTTRRHSGLGLGLAIAKQLVELHGGNIHAASAGSGAGATLTVSLPVSAVSSLASADEVIPRHPNAGPATVDEACIELDGVHVLVVDDEADARELVRRLLVDCKAGVTVVESAAEAMEQLRVSRPDVIVSDIGMPGEDGYDLIRQIRAMSVEEGGRTPAIALTAYARSEDRTRSILAGYQMHLAKPVEPAELIATIASLTNAASSRIRAVEQENS